MLPTAGLFVSIQAGSAQCSRQHFHLCCGQRTTVSGTAASSLPKRSYQYNVYVWHSQQKAEKIYDGQSSVFQEKKQKTIVHDAAWLLEAPLGHHRVSFRVYTFLYQPYLWTCSSRKAVTQTCQHKVTAVTVKHWLYPTSPSLFDIEITTVCSKHWDLKNIVLLAQSLNDLASISY